MALSLSIGREASRRRRRALALLCPLAAVGVALPSAADATLAPPVADETQAATIVPDDRADASDPVATIDADVAETASTESASTAVDPVRRPVRRLTSDLQERAADAAAAVVDDTGRAAAGTGGDLRPARRSAEPGTGQSSTSWRDGTAHAAGLHEAGVEGHRSARHANAATSRQRDRRLTRGAASSDARVWIGATSGSSHAAAETVAEGDVATIGAPLRRMTAGRGTSAVSASGGLAGGAAAFALVAGPLSLMPAIFLHSLTMAFAPAGRAGLRRPIERPG